MSWIAAHFSGCVNVAHVETQLQLIMKNKHRFFVEICLDRLKWLFWYNNIKYCIRNTMAQYYYYDWIFLYWMCLDWIESVQIWWRWFQSDGTQKFEYFLEDKIKRTKEWSTKIFHFCCHSKCNRSNNQKIAWGHHAYHAFVVVFAAEIKASKKQRNVQFSLFIFPLRWKNKWTMKSMRLYFLWQKHVA